MKWKTRLLLEIGSNDPIKELLKIGKPRIVSANLIDAKSMVVYYDNRKIKEAEILIATKCKLFNV